MLLTLQVKRSDGTSYLSDALTEGADLAAEIASVCLFAALEVGASSSEAAGDADVTLRAASLCSPLGQKNTAQKVPTIRTAAAA